MQDLDVDVRHTFQKIHWLIFINVSDKIFKGSILLEEPEPESLHSSPLPSGASLACLGPPEVALDRQG